MAVPALSQGPDAVANPAQLRHCCAHSGCTKPAAQTTGVDPHLSRMQLLISTAVSRRALAAAVIALAVGISITVPVHLTARAQARSAAKYAFISEASMVAIRVEEAIAASMYTVATIADALAATAPVFSVQLFQTLASSAVASVPALAGRPMPNIVFSPLVEDRDRAAWEAALAAAADLPGIRFTAGNWTGVRELPPNAAASYLPMAAFGVCVNASYDRGRAFPADMTSTADPWLSATVRESLSTKGIVLSAPWSHPLHLSSNLLVAGPILVADSHMNSSVAWLQPSSTMSSTLSMPGGLLAPLPDEPPHAKRALGVVSLFSNSHTIIQTALSGLNYPVRTRFMAIQDVTDGDNLSSLTCTPTLTSQHAACTRSLLAGAVPRYRPQPVSAGQEQRAYLSAASVTSDGSSAERPPTSAWDTLTAIHATDDAVLVHMGIRLGGRSYIVCVASAVDYLVPANAYALAILTTGVAVTLCTALFLYIAVIICEHARAKANEDAHAKAMASLAVAHAHATTLGWVSHALRNPCHIMAASAEFIAASLPSDHPSHSDVEAIRGGTASILRLLQDISNYNRLQAGELSRSLRIVNIRSFFDDLQRRARELMHSDGLPAVPQLRVMVDVNVPALMISDAARLGEVIDALLFATGATREGIHVAFAFPDANKAARTPNAECAALWGNIVVTWMQDRSDADRRSIPLSDAAITAPMVSTPDPPVTNRPQALDDHDRRPITSQDSIVRRAGVTMRVSLTTSSSGDAAHPFEASPARTPPFAGRDQTRTKSRSITAADSVSGRQTVTARVLPVRFEGLPALTTPRSGRTPGALSASPPPRAYTTNPLAAAPPSLVTTNRQQGSERHAMATPEAVNAPIVPLSDDFAASVRMNGLGTVVACAVLERVLEGSMNVVSHSSGSPRSQAAMTLRIPVMPWVVAHEVVSKCAASSPGDSRRSLQGNCDACKVDLHEVMMRHDVAPAPGHANVRLCDLLPPSACRHAHREAAPRLSSATAVAVPEIRMPASGERVQVADVVLHHVAPAPAPVPAAAQTTVIDRSPPASSATQAHSKRSLAGLRCLYADDDAVNRTLMTRMLRNLGCHCDTVPEGDDAVQRLLAAGNLADGAAAPDGPSKYHVLFLDIIMRRTDGTQICRQLRDTYHAALPIVAATANAHDRDGLLAAGFSAVLEKPFNQGAVHDVLCAVLPLGRSSHEEA